MDKDKTFYTARLAEKADRYDDMLEILRRFIKPHTIFNNEELETFAIAYKNAAGIRRKAWRNLKNMETADDIYNQQIITTYRQTIESELKKICFEVLGTLEKNLIPCSPDIKTRVDLLKMRGDFYRYLAEITEDVPKKEFSEAAAVAYKEASEIAISELSPTDPVRLGLALNFSVFFHDILEMPERACELAKAAFNDAVADLDSIKDRYYNEVSVAMQLLSDNLSLWVQDINLNTRNESYFNFF